MKLFARAIGAHPKYTIVFIHDFMKDSDYWNELTTKLGNSFHSVLIDLPGHGKSTNTSFDTWDEVIIEFSKVLTLIKRPIILVGHGLGGRIALGLCAKNHHQILKLILIDTIPGITDALSKQNKYIEDLKLFNELGSKLTTEQAGWKNAIKFLSLGRMPDYNKVISSYGSKVHYLLNTKDKAQMKLAMEYKSICEIEPHDCDPSQLFPTLTTTITKYCEN